MSARRTQSAFTLMEVLVAIIILAVGMLGLAGLQLAGMRNNHSSFLRTQATLAAADLIDRMRADPAAFRGRKLDAGTTTNVATFDRWTAELAGMLPAPAGGVSRGTADCTDTAAAACGTGHCAVTVRWDDSRVEAAADAARTARTTALPLTVCTRLPARA